MSETGEVQMSLFDFLGIPENIGEKYSSNDINGLIARLSEAQRKAKERELEEKRLRREEEQKRKALEEKRKREEHIREVTSMDLPLDWNNVFNTDSRTQGVFYESVSDALIYSVTTLGNVDIELISSITGKEYKEVINSLKGSIYQNPDTWGEVFYKGWETAEEYLSGNLMRKWKAAKSANEKYNGYFNDNIKAIEKVLPPTVATKDIYITLGSPWVPTDVIDDFIFHLFGDWFGKGWWDVSDREREFYQTKHDEITGTWEIPNKTRYHHSVAVSRTYGTGRMEALQILEKTLNMKSIVITDEVKTNSKTSQKKREINNAETLAAIEKQNELIKSFQDWVWKDEKRKERLEIIFENRYSCIRRRVFDGSFLEFPGMSDSVKLYPYQKNAVARIIFSPNTLLAHDVGSGKTYVMIAAGMELKRMGLSEKNLYVVPNNIVGQWNSIFLEMYPSANVLVVNPASFKPAKREKMLEKMRDEEFDAIIMAYSCFEQIPLSKEFYMEDIEERKKQIEEIATSRNKATGRLRNKRDELSAILADLSVTIDDMYDGVYFDELGITRLFVDEAHNFKNVPIETKANNVLGISSKGSGKCRDMMDKVHMIQKQNLGKGVVMATGTPITNSITDVYVMQQYLQSGELAMLDLQSFDSWIGMFAERRTEFEIDVDTSTYRLATRFAKFHNLPELTALLSMIADFHQADESNDIPKHEGYQDVLVNKSLELANYLKDISDRAEDVRSGYVSRVDDNMLKITTDGRKAALDIRLVDPKATFSFDSKVAECAEKVADIYFKTMEKKSTQLVFCDISTPKQDFNIYDELRERLEILGIPGEEIAYIHDAETEKKRLELFSRVQSGDIRIIIGSTFKLGLGVNIQNKLIALHHIDVPWRPADMTQREGRILRQGNENETVSIYRYITEGSFDAYSWQLLETKQRFISDLLSGSLSSRDGSDIEDTVLNYAEVKALAVGNPLVKKRVEAQNELARYQSLQKKAVENRLKMEKELLELPAMIKEQKDKLANCQKDSEYLVKWRKDNPSPESTKEKNAETEKRKLFREKLNQAIKDNEYAGQESFFDSYRGFSILLPSHMSGQKPYVWVKNFGKYRVDLADSEIGNHMRIDHLLDTFDERIKKILDILSELEKRKGELEEELSRKESYTDMIEKYKQLVDELDKKLGVNKND